jgi:hypothetical protein
MCTPGPYPRRLQGDKIRILHILPGRRTDPLRCRLSIVCVSKEVGGVRKCKRRHDYQALSYVWGGWEGNRSIQLQGHDGFAVTDNLYAALRRLRRSKTVRSIWTDALCINQNDVTERSAQVARMSSICQQAALTIVWLGDLPPATERDAYLYATALACLRHQRLDLHNLQAMEHLCIGKVLKRPGTKEEIEAQKLHDLFTLLLRAPKPPFWSQRTWIVQEIALSSWKTVLFGRWQMSWKHLA